MMMMKSDLMKGNSGNIVARQQHAAGRKACACIKGWVGAVHMARNELGMKGFAAVDTGSALFIVANAHCIA